MIKILIGTNNLEILIKLKSYFKSTQHTLIDAKKNKKNKERFLNKFKITLQL